jgi:tetratricopeptide (TPR) repeat protein
MTWLRYFFIAVAALASTAPGPVDATKWAAANEAYQNGKYEEAKVDYLQLVHAGQYSADLFYNLGNVWFKMGDQGRAILNYQRALLLNPRLDEARSNLRTVLKIVGNDDQLDFRGRVEAYADFFPLIASLAFWICAYSFLLAWRKRDRFKVLWLRSGVVAGFIFLSAAAVYIWIGTGAKDPNRALVIDSASELKYGPAVSARSVESLQIGEQVRLLSERGDWTFCRAGTGNLGWILTRKTEHLIP